MPTPNYPPAPPLVDPLRTGVSAGLPPPPPFPARAAFAATSILGHGFLPRPPGFSAAPGAPGAAGAVATTAGGTGGLLTNLRQDKRRPIQGSVKDATTLTVLTVFKLIRFLILWIALYFVDRAFQAAYLTRVMVEDRPPPPLWSVMAAALMIEAAFALMVIGGLALLRGRFKRPDNTFVLDGPMISALLADYFATTAVLLALGTALGAVAQSRRHLRYGEDGMRGIRALCAALLLVSAVVIAVV